MTKLEEYEDYIDYKILKGYGLIETVVTLQNVSGLIEEVWEDFISFHTTSSKYNFENIPRQIMWSNMRAMRKYLQEIRVVLEAFRSSVTKVKEK